MLGRQKSIPFSSDSGAQRDFRARILIVKISLLLFFLLIVWRLVQIQIIEAPKYQEIARRQYEARIPLPAEKGNIYDRNGNVLVSNSQFISFAADPKIVGRNAVPIAEQFARVFGKPRKHYLEKLKAEKRFVWLERRVAPDIGRRFEGKGFPGMVVLREPKRLYHYDEVAGQLLGFTDIDNKGLSGIELQFDQKMRGTDGYVVLQKDGLGNRKPSVNYPRVEPTTGPSLYLTIDLLYQSIAEEELEAAVKSNDASSGLVVAMNPRTGEILALAQYPGVNPNEVGRYPVENQRLRVVTDMFEPGSIFKLVTAAAALEADLVRSEQKFFAERGSYEVPLRNGRVRIIRDVRKYEWLTFQEAIELSSNIVMAKVSDLIGPERLYRKAKEFGYGARTGIDLPGEIPGELKKPNTWSATTLNTMAYGYEVGATPIQMLTAIAAIANGGTLLKPLILKKVVSSSGNTLEETKPQIVRRVLPEAVAQTLTCFLEGAVEHGTGKLAKIEGVRVAGKTGTSRKYVDGRYEIGSYTASFVGFFPAEDPQVVCLVMIDNPRGKSYYGSHVAAPVFRAIAQRIISTSIHIPHITARTVIAQMDASVSPHVPNVCNMKLEAARELLSKRGIRSKQVGEGEIVVRQSVEPGTRIERGEVVSLFVTRGAEASAEAVVEIPDLRGMSVRRAMNRLAIEELFAAVNGSGVVVSQSPLPGEKVKRGSKVYIYCEPKRSPAVAMN